MLNNKSRLIILVVSGFIFSSLYAGCGKCQADMTPSASKPSNALVTTVPKDGNIDGIVIASCGKCNFGVKKDRRCKLNIQVGDDIYPVIGTNIHQHGNAHSSEGFCSVVRVAYASGTIKKGKFHSDTFKLITSPE